MDALMNLMHSYITAFFIYMCVSFQVLITLCYLSSKETLLQLAERFDVSESTVTSSRRKIVKKIKTLGPIFLKYVYSI